MEHETRSSHPVGIDLCLLLLLLTGCLVDGCSQDDSGDKIFTAAGTQISQAWAKAKNLDAENDYMRAAEAYDSLRQMNLTQKQTWAVQKAIGNLYIRLRKAAATGDSNAIKILEDLRENMKKQPA